MSGSARTIFDEVLATTERSTTKSPTSACDAPAMADPPTLSGLLTTLIDTFEDYASQGQAVAPRGSAWEQENREARSTRGGGGRERAAIIDEVVHDAAILLIQVMGLSRGIATMVEQTEATNVYNQIAVSTLLRTQFESAAIVEWLLTVDLGPEERARRWLIWQFDDLASERNTIRQFEDPTAPALIDAQAKLDEREGRLRRRASGASFVDRPSDASGQHARLTRPSTKNPAGAGVAVEMPSKTVLVDNFCGFAGFYSILSRSAHGSRSGIIEGLVVADDEPVRGLRRALISPAGLDLHLALSCTGLGLRGSVVAVDRWCGPNAASSTAALKFDRTSKQFRQAVDSALPIK